MTIPSSLPTAYVKSHSLLHFNILRCHYQHVQVLPITAGNLWKLCRYIISPQEIDAIQLFLIYYRVSPMTSKSPKRNAVETEKQSFCEPCPTFWLLTSFFFQMPQLVQGPLSLTGKTAIKMNCHFFSYFMSTEPCCLLPSSSSMEPFPLFP